MEKKQVTLRVYEGSIDKIKKAQRLASFYEDKRMSQADTIEFVLGKYISEVEPKQK